MIDFDKIKKMTELEKLAWNIYILTKIAERGGEKHAEKRRRA